VVLFALIVGLVLIVAAVRNAQGALFASLYADVPDFVVWAAAIFAIGAIGFIPGLKPVSRGLLALIVVVLVMNNYKNILSGFQETWQKPTEADPVAHGEAHPAAASGNFDLSNIANLAGGVDGFARSATTGAH
jgi:hypothetical protein